MVTGGRYFDYGETELAYLRARDSRLGAVIAKLGHIYRGVDPDLFAAVVRHIIGQQISARAQQTVWERLRLWLGAVSPQTLQGVTREQLQGQGMTFRKADYILDFTSRVTAGQFDMQQIAQLSDAAALARLTELKGVGVWTAEMILLFGLQRPDILSYGDLAIQRGMRMIYRRHTIDRPWFEARRARFSPYGSTASLYFWAVAGGALPGYSDPAAQ